MGLVPRRLGSQLRQSRRRLGLIRLIQAETSAKESAHWERAALVMGEGSYANEHAAQRGSRQLAIRLHTVFSSRWHPSGPSLFKIQGLRFKI